jgi:transcriptional regulator with XRE-family HTH domain
MGGPGSGRHPDPARQRRAAERRAQGLSYAAIGQRLGVTKQTIGQLLRVPAGPARCRCCDAPLAAAPLQARYRRGALCLACLARTPRATVADRLLAYRVSAGLTQEGLAARAGTTRDIVSAYERGWRRPRPEVLRRLAEVLGPGLLADVPGVAP